MKRVTIILSVVLVILAVVAFSNDGALLRKLLSGVAETEAIAADQKPAPNPDKSAAPKKDVAPSVSPEKTDTEPKPQDKPEQIQTPEKKESVDPDAAKAVTDDDPKQGDSADVDDEEFNDQLMKAFGDVRYDPNYTGGFGGGMGGPGLGGIEIDIPEEEPMESINLNNIEMKNIVQTLGEWTGKPIIPTADDVMSKRITIYATKKVPRSKALSLILAALKAKGVIAEQSEDKIFLKPIASAKLGSVPTVPADEPLEKYSDRSQIVEKFFKLENYSPTKLVSVISPLIADYGHVTAMEDTGNVAVIDSIENLIRIERIIKQLDVPESELMVEETFKIENADPIEVVQVLELILDTNRRDGYRGRPRPPTPSAAGSKGAATSVVIEQGEVPVKLIPVPKHNWVIARASAEVMDQIAVWIEKLDRSETVQSQQTIIQVRFANVREVEETLDNTIRQMPEEIRAQVIIEPLVQAKQIIVFGSEDNRKMIERLVAEIDLPKLDIFTEKTFKLKHADPDQIKENIDGLYGESSMNSRSSYGYNPYSRYNRYGSSSSNEEDTVKAISYPTMSTVTVIASEKNMAKIEKQITEEWDIPLDIEKDQYRILTLKNSDPVQMTNLLTKLFSEDSSSGNRDMFRFIFGGRGNTETKKKIVGSLYGMLTFEPVPETKKLIVISKIPEAYDVIEKLINELDSQEKAEVPKVITLNYADAEDLCDQLNAILNESGTQATLQRSTRGLSEMESESGGVSSSGAAASNTGNQTITPWWTRQRNVTGEEMPTSNLIGQIRFIPVARSKAILVLAPPEYHEDIEAMIAELDKPGMQVMIKVVIMEVNHSNMTSIGVQIATDSGMTNAYTENGLTILSTLDYLDNVLPWTMSAGGNINTLIDLMVKNVSAKILNQPTLWTKDNEEAVFIKGKQVAIITGDQDSANGITRSYDYNDVGLTLRIRPNITPEKYVDMTVNLIISQVDAEEINEQVTISNLDTTTHLIVNNGQTIMLGGILFQNDTTIKRKVPFFGDIPIVGELFRHNEKQVANDELLCFITPYVIDSASLDAIPADGDTDAQLKQPFQRMEKIKSQMDIAMDWLSDEIGEERTDIVSSDADSEDADAVIEAESDKTQQ